MDQSLTSRYQTERQLLLEWIIKKFASRFSGIDPQNIDKIEWENIDSQQLLRSLDDDRLSIPFEKIFRSNTTSETKFTSQVPPPLPPKNRKLTLTSSNSQNPSALTNAPTEVVPAVQQISDEVPNNNTKTIKFEELHNNYSAAIRRSAQLAQLQLMVFQLTPQELLLTSYECLLLATLHQPPNSKIASTIYDSIRPQMNLTTKNHAAILNNVKLEDTSTYINVLSIDHRLSLLKSKKSSLFQETQESYTQWKSRQCRLIFNCMYYILVPFKSETAKFENTQLDVVDYLSHLKLLIQAIMDCDELSDEMTNELSDVIHRSQGSSSLVIPYPLNVELMEQIISYGLFDQDEKSLQHLQNEDDMMPVFNHLMIPLKITSNMYSTLLVRLAFHQFKNRLEDPSAHNYFVAQVGNLSRIPCKDETENDFKKQVFDEILNWIQHSMNDYHHVGTGHSIMVILKVYKEYLHQNLITPTPLNVVYSGWMTKTAEQVFKRIATEYKVEYILPLADGLKHLKRILDADATIFVPIFVQYGLQPPGQSEPSTFTKELAQHYSNHMVQFQTAIAQMNMQTAKLQRTIQALNNVFMKHGVRPQELPDCVTLFSGVINNFVEDQDTRLTSFVTKLQSTLENFLPIDTKRNRQSSSIVDLFGMINAPVPLLTAVRGYSISEFFIATTVNTVNRTLQQYINEVILDACKYKDEMFPLSGNEKIKGKRESKFVQSLNKVTKKEPIPPMDPTAFAFMVAQRIDQLCVRLNNLVFAKEKLGEFKAAMLKNTQNEKLSKFVPSLDEEYWHNTAFATTENLIDVSITMLMRYIAAKIVFIDLRKPFIETLYVPNVTASEMKMEILVHSFLDSVLEKIMASLFEDISSRLICYVYRMMLLGMEFILLFGGNMRLYQPIYAQTIRDDITLLEKFFIAEDEKGVARGLSDSVVKKHSQRLRSITHDLFEYSTEYFIQNYSKYRSFQEGTTTGNIDFQTKEHALCILIHRQETPARNFIKAQSETLQYKCIKRGRPVIQDVLYPNVAITTTIPVIDANANTESNNNNNNPMNAANLRRMIRHSSFLISSDSM